MKTERMNAVAAQWLSERTSEDWFIQDGVIYQLTPASSRKPPQWHLFSDSLDSMALLEGQLTEQEWRHYERHLRDFIPFGGYLGLVGSARKLTAPQLLEAFLRAVNLWESQE